MVIEVYTVDQLRTALGEKDFWFQNVAPITKHRAQLVINNPRSNADDPVLFIAREEKNIIGYRVVFPDKIFMDGESRRIGWGSSFWVSDTYRGKGVGRLLFEKSFAMWGGNIGSLIQSRDAAKVYERDPNFYCFNESIGYQFVTKLNTRFWVQKRLRLPAVIAFALSLIDLPVNAVLGTLRSGWVVRKKPLKNFRLEYCREITDQETIQFINRNNIGSLSRKTVEDINAIVRYPTSMATPLEDAIGLRYYFNIRSSRFDYLYLKVYDLNLDLKGVMLMNIDGGGLRLLYYFYELENTPDALFDIFLVHAARLGTEIITSYDSTFNNYMLRKSGFPRLFSRKQVRKSFIPVTFREPGLLRYKIYDGDGA